MPPPSKSLIPLQDRFWSKVMKPAEDEGCWLWTGCRNDKGYGCIWSSKLKRHLYAHRVVMLLFGHKIPSGKVVHHTCGVRLCVNPKHLEITTFSENNLAENRQKMWGGPARGIQMNIDFIDAEFSVIEPGSSDKLEV